MEIHVQFSIFYKNGLQKNSTIFNNETYVYTRRKLVVTEVNTSILHEYQTQTEHLIWLVIGYLKKKIDFYRQHRFFKLILLLWFFHQIIFLRKSNYLAYLSMHNTYYYFRDSLLAIIFFFYQLYLYSIFSDNVLTTLLH